MSDLGQQIIEETCKVAKANPSFVYDGDCIYVRDDQPACLIGHALWNLGLIDISLGHHVVNSCGVSRVAEFLKIPLDDAEEYWLTEAQSAQDEGDTWGDAIERANDRLAFANEWSA